MRTVLATYTDEELFVLISQGNERAFTEIYDRYWDKIFFVAALKLNDFTLAEDIVQELMGDIWRRRETIDLRGNFEPYIRTALKYKIINALAARKRERAFSIDGENCLQPVDRSTEDRLAFEDLRGQLHQLVAKLPDRCRLTFQLRQEEGLSQKEVAYVMNISEKAVEKNFSRAMRSIRLGLKQFIFTFF